jgi:predicted transcriptional regulator
MGCVNPDGSLTASAWQMLKLLQEPYTAEKAASLSGLPVFKVRASLREMVGSGLIELVDNQYQLTQTGRDKLNQAP